MLDSCGAKDTAGTATPQVQLNSWQELGAQPQHLKAALTQADKNSLQGLIGGCLQVEEGQLVVSAQLHLVADGFEQRGGAVQLGGKTATVTSSRTLHSTARASSHPLRMGSSASQPPWNTPDIFFPENRKTTGQTMAYLVLGLLQVPARPQGEAEAVTDFGFIFSATQLLCQPQSWKGVRVRECQGVLGGSCAGRDSCGAATTGTESGAVPVVGW